MVDYGKYFDRNPASVCGDIICFRWDDSFPSEFSDLVEGNKMKAYKIEILVLDYDNIGEHEIRNVIENTRYSNRCIDPEVKSIESRDVGPWSDAHPLNDLEKADAEYKILFAPSATDKLSDAIGTAKRDIEDGEVIEIKLTPIGWESEAIDFSLLNAKMRKPPK